MKRNFGGLMTRLLRGGTKLTEAEYFILASLVERLDAEIRGVVESHFEEYNLAQREVDGRTLNFYKHSPGKGAPIGVSRPLAMTLEEAPLVKIALKVPGEEKLLHAVLTAVGGRTFCVTIDRPLLHKAFSPGVEVVSSTQSWRSGVSIRAA